MLSEAVSDTTKAELLEEVKRLRSRVAELEERQRGESDVAGTTAENVTHDKQAATALNRAHRELERHVVERTAELAEINRQLSEEIEIRKETEQELKLSAEIMDNMAEGVILIRVADGEIVFTNPTYNAIFGYDPGELIGQHATILLAAGKKTPEKTAAEINRGGEEHGSWNGEIHNIHKDGTDFWTNASISKFAHPQHGDVWVGVQQNITQRRRAEQELKLSVEIMENMAEGVCLLRASDGRLVFTNPRFDQIFGYETGELLGRHTAILNAPGEKTPKETADEILRDLEETGIWSGEVHNIRKDETPIWTHSSVSTFKHPKHGTVRVAVVEDITERKRAEEALRESEDRFRNLFENSPDANLLLMDGMITDCNQAALSMLRGTREQVIGLPPSALSPEFQPDGMRSVDKGAAVVRNAIEAGSHRFEWMHRRFDGTDFCVEVAATALTFRGKRALIGTWRDITDRKRAETALRESEERLDLAVRGTSDGLWDSDIESGKEYWSPRFKELLGYGEDEIEATHDQFLALLHPEDKPNVLEAIRLHLEENRPYDCELRLQTKCGEYRWFQSRGKALRDENGKPYRMAGSIRDITERKQAEEALRRNEYELRTITDNLPAMICFVDSQQRYQFVNRSVAPGPKSSAGMSANCLARRTIGHTKSALRKRCWEFERRRRKLLNLTTE